MSATTIKSEKSTVPSIFHAQNNTFPVPLYFRMKDIEAPQPASLQALSYATRYRAAVKTLTRWKQNLVDVNKCRSEAAPMDWLVGRAHSSPWWDTPPIVDLVADAASDFNNQFGDLTKDIRKLGENSLSKVDENEQLFVASGAR